MKFFRSSISATQLSDFKHTSTGKCVPGVLRRRLPCFHGHATHHRIKESTQLCNAIANPGIVAKLMGLDSVPQRTSSVNRKDHGNLNAQSQPLAKTPMVLQLENGKFFVLGFETGCKGKGDSRSNSKRKLPEDDGSKKKKPATETSNLNEASKKSPNVDFELEFLDQLVLELVYIF